MLRFAVTRLSRTFARRACSVAASLLAICVACASCARRAHAPTAATRRAAERDTVLAFLRDWVRRGADGRETLGPDGRDDQETFVIAAPLESLPPGSSAWVAHLSGDPWCGSGGCETLVVARDSGASWRVISEIPVNHLPVIVLASSHDGWPDLVTNESGARSEWMLVRHDGDRYVDASLTWPAHPPGRVLLSDTMRVALLDSLAPVDSLTAAWRTTPLVRWSGLTGRWTVTIPSRGAVVETRIGETPTSDSAARPAGWPAFMGAGVLRARGQRWPLRCTISVSGYVIDSLDVVDRTRRTLELNCAIPDSEVGDHVTTFWTTVPSSGVVPDSLSGHADWIAPWTTGETEWDPRPASATRHGP